MEHNHHPNQEEEKIIFTCPMHPEIKQDRPGMCPECGMALVPVKKDKSRRKVGILDFDKSK